MKKILFFAVFLLVIAGVSFSCKKPEEKINYPIEMSFSDYSLEGTSCQWINLPYDEKVIVINSNEELNKYISCTEESFPAIDFSKQTLLLASGKANSNITALMTKSFQQTSVNNYELNIEITLYEAPVVVLWNTAILVEKISENHNVEINESLMTDSNNELSLVFTKWKLIGIVDVENNTIQELEPEDCIKCYTLGFDTDSTIFGRIHINSMGIRNIPNPCPSYEIDYNTGALQFGTFCGNAAIERPDGMLYYQLLFKTQSFKIIVKDSDQRILHLYNNDDKKYLKYKEIEYEYDPFN